MSVAFPTCDARCAEGNAHSATCRSRRHRAARGRAPQGYVVTEIDRAAMARAREKTPIPAAFLPRQVPVVVDGNGEAVGVLHADGTFERFTTGGKS